MSAPIDRRPDPWAVVSYHADAAANRPIETPVNDAARLALYATAAPEVISAERVSGMPGSAGWWTAPIVGSSRRLLWSDAGQVMVVSDASAVVRRITLAAIVGLTALNAWAPPPLGVAVALAAGALADAVAIRLSPFWLRRGNTTDALTASRTLDALLQRYEAPVSRVG